MQDRIRLTQAVLFAMLVGACTNRLTGDEFASTSLADAETGISDEAASEVPEAGMEVPDAEAETTSDADSTMPEGADTGMPEADVKVSDADMQTAAEAGRDEDATLADGSDNVGGHILDAGDAATDASPLADVGPTAPWGEASPWPGNDTQEAFDYRCGVHMPSDSAAFLDVGYTGVQDLALFGDRVLIHSTTSWSVWDRSDRTRISQGDGRVLVPGAQIFATYDGSNLALRSTVDGRSLLTRPGSQMSFVVNGDNVEWRGGLARDGSYYWYWVDGRIYAVTLNGTTWLDQATQATIVDAKPTELRVVDGNTLRTYARSGSAPSEVAFTGQFSAFALEGYRFVTYDGYTARLYEGNGTLVGSADIGAQAGMPLGTVGDWLWTMSHGVYLFRVGLDTPVLAVQDVYPEYVGPWAATSSRLVLPGHVIDLTSGREMQAAAPSPRGTMAIAADGNDWVSSGITARNGEGVLIAQDGVHGPEHEYFGCGPIVDVQMGENGLAFLTTARGVFVFDVPARSMRGFVRVQISTQLGAQIAEDGSVLFLSDGIYDDSFAVFAIDRARGPTPMLGRPSIPTPTPFSRLSPDGHWLGISGTLVNLDSSTVSWNGYSGDGVPYPSPAATRVAGTPGLGQPESWTTFTIHDRSGVLLGTATGAPMKWLSDDALITGNEQNNSKLRAIGVNGAKLYGDATCPGTYRGISRIQRLGETNLYLPSHGMRCDIATGQTSQVPAYRGVSASALFGDQAVYVVGSQAALRPATP